MPRQSTVKRLPFKVQKRIERLLEEGRTLDEIIEHLSRMGVEDVPSRSALGRYRISVEELAAESRQLRETARVVASEVGDQSATALERANIELLHQSLMKLRFSQDEFSTQEVMQMAKAVHSLSSASKINLERIKKEREEAVEAFKAEASEKLDQVKASAKGLDDDVIDRIRRDVLGVRG